MKVFEIYNQRLSALTIFAKDSILDVWQGSEYFCDIMEIS